MTTPLEQVLHEHWEQLRHVERLRYGFVNIYVVVVGGLLAVAVNAPNVAVYPIIASFIVLISIVGVVINVKLGLEYFHHISYVSNLASKLDVDQEMGRPLGMYEEPYGPSDFAAMLDPRNWRELLLDPPSVRTSELLSPGHWVLALSLTGMSSSLGWLTVILLRLLTGSPGAPGVPAELLGVAIGILSIGVSAAVIYAYTHRKMVRIRREVDRRIPSDPEED